MKKHEITKTFQYDSFKSEKLNLDSPLCETVFVKYLCMMHHWDVLTLQNTIRM